MGIGKSPITMISCNGLTNKCFVIAISETNKDVVPDDLVSVFHKQSCSFGFATHLFGSELKALYSIETVPRGIKFRISPTSHSDL